MKFEKEITVRVNCGYEALDDELRQQGFKIIENYQLDDIYVIPASISVERENILDILNASVIIRNIGNTEKALTYKFKKYSNDGEILEQSKIDCYVKDEKDALEFMNAIGYKELLRVYDNIIVYSNDKIEFAVQLVNDKYIYIELEDTNGNTGKFYSTIEEMIEDIKSLHLDIDYSDFYAKKVVDIFNDTFN